MIEPTSLLKAALETFDPASTNTLGTPTNLMALEMVCSKLLISI